MADKNIQKIHDSIPNASYWDRRSLIRILKDQDEENLDFLANGNNGTFSFDKLCTLIESSFCSPNLLTMMKLVVETQTKALKCAQKLLKDKFPHEGVFEEANELMIQNLLTQSSSSKKPKDCFTQEEIKILKELFTKVLAGKTFQNGDEKDEYVCKQTLLLLAWTGLSMDKWGTAGFFEADEGGQLLFVLLVLHKQLENANINTTLFSKILKYVWDYPASAWNIKSPLNGQSNQISLWFWELLNGQDILTKFKTAIGKGVQAPSDIRHATIENYSKIK